jgi:hypothetical protein
MMRAIEFNEVIKKIINVVNSCETIEQFEVAERMVDSFNKKYGVEHGYIEIDPLIYDSKIKTDSIVNWELHHKLINSSKKFEVCIGIGLNQFFPEYITIDLSHEFDKIVDIDIIENYNKKI